MDRDPLFLSGDALVVALGYVVVVGMAGKSLTVGGDEDFGGGRMVLR
jgi:hypothetical protein